MSTSITSLLNANLMRRQRVPLSTAAIRVKSMLKLANATVLVSVSASSLETAL